MLNKTQPQEGSNKPEEEIRRLKQRLEEEIAKNALLGEHIQQLQDGQKSSLPFANEKRLSAIQDFDSFNHLSIPAWEQDFSQVAQSIKALQVQGINSLSSYFDSRQDEFFRLLKQIKIIHHNKEAEMFTPKDMAYSSLLDLYLPEAYQSILKQFYCILRGEKRLTTELPIELPNGEKRYYILKWIAIEHPIPYKRVLVSLVNITDRHAMEEKLAETNRQLSTLIKNLSGIVYQCKNDNHWTMQYLSDTVQEITGYCCQELLFNKKKSFADLIHPEDRKSVEREVQQAIQKHHQFSIEYRITTKKGEERWVWEQGVGIPGHNPEHIETLEGYILDITDRKHYEEALLQSEEKFKKAFHASPMAIMLAKERDGRIIEANDSFTEITGWTKEEYDGKTSLELGIWSNPSDRIDFITTIQQEGKVKAREYLIFRKSGHLRNVIISGYPMQLGGERVIIANITDITEQRQAQVNLKNERTHLRTVLETIPDLIWLKDPDGIYLNCNYQFELFFGATEAEIIGKTDYDFVSKELADFFRVNDKRAMQANQAMTNLEWVTFANDGHRALLETVKTPMCNSQGELVGVLGIARDITKIKLNEEALKESEVLYKAIFNNTGTATCLIDENRTLILVNEKFERLSGYSKKELEHKKKWTDFVAAGDLVKMQKHHDRRRESPQNAPKHYEFTFIDRKQAKHHIFLNIDMIPGTKTSVASLLDVSVRINALNELRQSHEKYQNLVENINDIIYELDADWNFSYISPRVQAITGYPPSHYLGKYFLEVVAERDKADVEKRFDGFLKQKDNLPLEFRAQTLDGQTVWLRISVRPVIKKNHIIGLRGIGSDITRQKRTEQELINAKEKAEAADRLKSAFLATMSHELRTPLNAIIGFSQLIDESLPPAEMVDMGKIIHSSGNHLLSIIESIFELTMLQSKQTKLRVENFTAQEIGKSLEFFMKSELKKYDKQNISFSFSGFNAAKQPNIQSDKTKLTQLLTNLISNSVKYSNKGKITVECQAKQKSVIFCVKDEGIGIAQEMLEVIFERFRQVDDSSTRRYEGVGLGLSICKEIAELLHGKIWVESAPLKGSKFYFKLPLTQENNAHK
ncbi:PAS domain S-box protein [Sunxiuqinia elliptica]